MVQSLEARQWNIRQRLRPGENRALDRRIEPRRPSNESRMIFALSLGLYFVVAYSSASHLGLVSPEATRRAALASLIIAGDVSSLFAASPSTPPLPIILQLPLELLPLLSSSVMSITLLAVVSSALTCCLTNRILVDLNVAWNCRYPLVALFALNPGMLAHSSTGSS